MIIPIPFLKTPIRLIHRYEVESVFVKLDAVIGLVGFVFLWPRIIVVLTSTTMVVLEAQWGIRPEPCVLRQYTVVFA